MGGRLQTARSVLKITSRKKYTASIHVNLYNPFILNPIAAENAAGFGAESGAEEVESITRSFPYLKEDIS